MEHAIELLEAKTRSRWHSRAKWVGIRAEDSPQGSGLGAIRRWRVSDVAKIRSYIAALRVLREAAEPYP